MHCDEKMLSSSVVCLSFTILNTFETKKGIKILVYSSVRYRLRAVSLFSVVRRAKREKRKWPRA